MEEVLTEREREVAKLVSAGLTNSQIAGILRVAQGTVDAHIVNIFNKLHLRNRVELTNYWAKLQAA
jgi:DNA-binding NarL/FixJ family response regulator